VLILGEDEETKKQKQKQLIDAAFKLKTENTEKNETNGHAEGLEDSGDGGCCLGVSVAIAMVCSP